MPKVNLFKIDILDPQDVYYPGQTVRGHVILELNDVTYVNSKQLFYII